tara:strand:+ start:364 stop:513 length:150 start_codon:yes stop_codon:yes gene_type:complete
VALAGDQKTITVSQLMAFVEKKLPEISRDISRSLIIIKYVLEEIAYARC